MELNEQLNIDSRNKAIPLNVSHRETKELDFNPFNGCCMLLINLLLLFGSITFIIVPSIYQEAYLLAIAVPCFIISIISLTGHFTLNPNEAGVLVFYGTYKGTIKESGFFWCNPLMTLTRLSMRSRNLNGQTIKVNDLAGNPIEIAIVVVWSINNTAKALFDVENYEYFVLVNSESAVRHLALSFPYEKTGENDISLRGNNQIVINQLVSELHERLSKAGIDVQEARITHLAYAPEIAGVMLKRQQADAVIAAREKIVQGAVAIVGHALNSLRQNNIVEMNNDEKSRLVSNMLVVLCSESHVQPVLNTGTTYSN